VEDEPSIVELAVARFSSALEGGSGGRAGDNTWWPLSTRRGDPQIQSARRRNAASAGTWRRGRFGESRPESSHRVT